MSDELTPEEKAAFESLPRERMPAGLEAKVVDAMREHGFLAKDAAKKRRAIELTGGRVAGVLAASVALVIVAYSVGVHRGGGREMIMPTETITTPEPVRKYTELGAPPSVGEAEKDRQAEAPAVDALEPQELKKEMPAAPASRADEAVEERSEALRSSDMDLRAKKLSDAQSTTPSTAGPATREPSQGAPEPAARLQPSASMEAFSPSKPMETVTFLWGGETYQLEADSVRVVEDERGRTLHIYTSDGVIRIRLAE